MDYVEAMNLYPLKSINRMESEFLSLVSYNLFVSAEMYTQYYLAVREISNPIFKQVAVIAQPKAFNRFKTIAPEQVSNAMPDATQRETKIVVPQQLPVLIMN